jgi:hypothetical protein
MLQIVRLFLPVIVGFCLTISLVWADEVRIVLPKVIIDYSDVAANIYQQQAKLWLFTSLMAMFLGFIAYALLNAPSKKTQVKAEAVSAGDLAAKNALLIWLIFFVVLGAGFALPALRLWMMLSK